MLVLLGGMDTTSGTTGNSLLLIDRDPALRQQMIDEVDNMPKIIEEFLRIAGPGGGLYRRLTKDVEFHGEQMHEGDTVLMMFWAANRDPKAFPDPETIDIHPHQQPAHGVRARPAPLPRLAPRPADAGDAATRRLHPASPTSRSNGTASSASRTAAACTPCGTCR